MATNVKYNDGEHLSWPVAEGTESGDFVLVGDQGLYGVAMTDRGEGGNPSTHASLRVPCGPVFSLPISTTTAADIGDKVYAVPATGVLTPVSTDNTHVGWFYSAKGTTADEVCDIALAKV